jgi:hypothetical protein
MLIDLPFTIRFGRPLTRSRKGSSSSRRGSRTAS